jgi:hypothetical protein
MQVHGDAADNYIVDAGFVKASDDTQCIIQRVHTRTLPRTVPAERDRGIVGTDMPADVCMKSFRRLVRCAPVRVCLSDIPFK